MKMVKKAFEGQLSGDAKKEALFGRLREEFKLKLPVVGKKSEYNLPAEVLDGAFLSMLDGKGSLTVNGKSVSKIKVYKGEEPIPATFTLTLKVNMVSDTSKRLSAIIAGK